jgi:hypothetical protein
MKKKRPIIQRVKTTLRYMFDVAHGFNGEVSVSTMFLRSYESICEVCGTRVPANQSHSCGFTNKS